MKLNKCHENKFTHESNLFENELWSCLFMVIKENIRRKFWLAFTSDNKLILQPLAFTVKFNFNSCPFIYIGIDE